MEARGKIALFLSEYRMQVAEIEEIYKRLQEKSILFEEGIPEDAQIESTGYWLHNLYSAYEDLFKLVSRFWENNITDNGGYHVNLLKRMRVEIPGIRPALLSQSSYKSIDNLRGFRHVFRHAYSFGLDGERVTFLLTKVLNDRSSIMTELNQFTDKFV